MLKTGLNACLILALSIGVILIAGAPGTPVDQSEAATAVQSIQSGNWSSSSTWSGRKVPEQGDKVTIAVGHTVIYDVLSNAVLGPVTVHGTLRFSRAVNTRLKTSGNIIVMTDGFLDMGTQDDFIPRDVKAEVIFVLPRGKQFTGGPAMALEDTGLWVMGRWEIHGAPLLRTWSKLAQDASVGARIVVVENDVTDWHIGGQVVVTQTSNPLRPEGNVHYKMREAYFFENEVRTITALEPLSGGRAKISLDQPLEFFHQGSGRIRGEVGLLTRNVLIRTEISGVSDATLDQAMRERRFAHTMFMHTGEGHIQYTEFKYMGHLATLARYPIHQHMLGLKEEGMVVIRGNSIWRSGNRGYQPHDSQGILFEDNVSYDTIMSPFYIERTPVGPALRHAQKNNPALAPNDIWFVHNLGVQSSKAPDKGSAPQNDDAIFWIEQHDNVLIGNVGVAGGAYSGSVTGDIPSGGTGPGSASTGFGLFTSNRSDRTGNIRQSIYLANEFRSNARHGVRFWNRDGVNPVNFVDLSVSRNGLDGINWGYYASPHRLYRLSALENRTGVAVTTQVGSNTRFIQDAEIIGNGVGIQNDYQIVNSIYPDRPYTYIRVFFDNINADIVRGARECAGEGATWVLASRSCHGSYTLLLKPIFNAPVPIGLGIGQHQANLANGGNPNTMWRVKDAQGLDPDLPDDFLLMRPDQIDPANRSEFASAFLSGADMSLYDNDKWLLVPTDSLPNEINTRIWGKNDNAVADRLPFLDHPYTWEKEVDYPPEVSLNISIGGKLVTMRATAADDKVVTGVEFYVDDQVVATTTTAPYEVTIDLSDHPRKFAYLYAVAYDGHIIPEHWNPVTVLGSAGVWGPDYEQRGYSNVIEIGPEVLLGEQTSPAPARDPLEVDAGPDQIVTLPTNTITLNGVVTDDSQASSELRVKWSKVSGPGSVTFADPASPVTTATFSAQGIYVLRLTASDGELSASDEVTVAVNPQPELDLVLQSITVSPSAETVEPGASHQFNATGVDQHGNPIAISPTWEVSGGGSISESGLFTAGTSAGGPYTVTATVGAVSGAATVTVDTTGNPSNIYGDATGDGAVDSVDINEVIDWLIATRPMPGSDDRRFIAADVDGSGSISLADVNLMVDRLLGRIDRFPVE